MKKAFLFCIIFFLTVTPVISQEKQKVCPVEKIKVGPIIIYTGKTKVIYKGHSATYGGLFNNGNQYQIKFDDDVSFYTSSNAHGESTVEATQDKPPFFVEFEAIEWDKDKIVFILTRFQKSPCYDPNVRIKRVGE